MSNDNHYALILGSSSGFGKSSAIQLAKMGYNIFGMHLDVGTNKKHAELLAEEIRSYGVKCLFFNKNAADEAQRKEIVAILKEELINDNDAKIRVYIHSLAFGALGPIISHNREELINQRKIEMTMNVMGNSFLFWAQDLFLENMFCENARIISLTSSGSIRAMKGYGAVSAAKAALEAYTRQLAVELAPYKITVNALMPGVTDTPAAQKLPEFQRLKEVSASHNPYGRNTIPDDVAKAIALMIDEKSYWITGQTIGVDGGESICNAFE
ncbi:MAG: SDR family oxidoreductase [Bacteroidota bacterium]